MSYLFAAYSVIWIILFVYLIMLWKKQKRLEQDLEILKTRAIELGKN